jgi:hypothetical protein
MKVPLEMNVRISMVMESILIYCLSQTYHAHGAENVMHTLHCAPSLCNNVQYPPQTMCVAKTCLGWLCGQIKYVYFSIHPKKGSKSRKLILIV